MATEKQVQSLAKKMATLIGKIDLQVEKRTNDYSQEATNKVISEELAKKSKHID